MPTVPPQVLQVVFPEQDDMLPLRPPKMVARPSPPDVVVKLLTFVAALIVRVADGDAGPFVLSRKANYQIERLALL